MVPPPFADAIPVKAESPPPLILPDDSPTPVHSKIGPLGQILKSATTVNAAKKKSKAKAPQVSTKTTTTTAAGMDIDAPPAEGAASIPNTPVDSGLTSRFESESPRKNKAAYAPKKKKAMDPLPAVVFTNA